MIFLSLPAAAQTQIDLRTQTKSVDFTAAVSTKPLKTGSVLPATCQVGDMFFNTDATAGANLYGCTAAGTWSVQGGSSASCGYDTVDGTLKCRDAQGVVYATVRTANSGTANQWVDYIAPTGVPHTSQPTSAAVGAVADPGSNGVPYRSGLGVATPATADRLSGPFSCQDTGSSGAYACDLAPPITAYNTGTTYWFKANSANTGAVTINFNSLGPKRIVRSSGQDLAAGDITGGQWVMLTYNGAAMQMQSQTSTTPAAGVSSMFGRIGAVTAQAGDYTTAQVTESGNLYFTNTRARAALGTGGPLTLNLSTGIFDCPACLTTTTPADTDLYGNYPHLSVIRIQGRPVATAQPSDLQYLGWNNTAGQWEPKTPPAALVTSVFGRTGALVAAAGDYTTAQVTESGNLYFTNARVWAALSGSGPITLNTSTGAFGCPNCISTSTSADMDLAGSFPHLSVTRIQGRPVASGPPADAQYLGWNTSANQWEPRTLPAAQVASVFGRMGPVVSQNGDYSFAQISGSASAAQLPAAAMRTDQSNTVAAGTQDFRGAAHTLPMKSGLTASLPSLCTTGELYFAADAPPGQNTYGCTATNTWSIQGNLTVKSDDSTVGRRGAINFEAGAGIMTVMTDSGSEINVLLGLDTAVVQTPWGEQTGSALLCGSTGGSSSSYQCSLQPTLQEYTTGMTLHWTPDVNGTGGATTLNVDTLGATAVKLADGVTDPASTDIQSGQLYVIWYDGGVFRLPPRGGGGGGTWGSITGTLSNQTDLASALSGKQAALTNYSTISGLTGYPSTFPPINSGDWAGSWNGHAVGYFQTAISGAPGSWPSLATVATSGSYADLSSKPSLGTAASHASTDFAASNASTTVNGQTCTLGSSCTISTGSTGSGTDILRFGICFTAGCGSEATINYIAPLVAGSWSVCAFNLAVAPTGSSVIVDVQNGSGVSIFGATKLVVPEGSTAVVTQGTFANSPQTFSATDKFKAVVLQNDSGNTAQGGTVQCR
jgi:hypothetical protein